MRRGAFLVLMALSGATCSPPDLGSVNVSDEGGGAGKDVAPDIGKDAPSVEDNSTPDELVRETFDGEARTVDTRADEATTCDPGNFCANKECGPDPCGGQCKTKCWAHQECFAWKCRDEGEQGFSCASDEECADGHCVLWEDGMVCTVYCADDADCDHPDWACEITFGSSFCMPPCEPATCEDLGAECGAPDDGCFAALDCGVCEGEFQACGEDFTCGCAFQPCGEDLCCGEDENCVAGTCWSGPIPCDPPCGEDQHCTDLGECIPCCTFGAFCDEVDICYPGLVCTGGVCCFLEDATCDGVDDDCDGGTDDDYVSDGSCGLGPCLEGNSPSNCENGVETPCLPGLPLAAEDTTCDGVDDDCDGQSDDDYVSDGSCGLGSCQEGNSPSVCQGGVETPCVPGEPAGEDDATCDAVDDDCDGDTDEDYQTDDGCGVGWCRTNNLPSVCVDGIEIQCQPGEPGEDETTCNGVDDDCDGATDEDFPVDGSCGVGACLLFNTPSACTDGVETPCIPAVAAEQDTICNGLDDDCDGDTDEDFQSDGSCGVGWCLFDNVPSSCNDGIETPCVEGQPLADLDLSCDSVDSDCDGMTDEDADPPCSFGAPVVGASVVFLSEGGLPSGLVSDNGDGTYSTAVVDISRPGLLGSVTAMVGGMASEPMGFTVMSGNPTATTLHVNRTLVFRDVPVVRCCLHTVDAAGSPAGPGFEAGFYLDIADFQVSSGGTYEGDGFYCGWLEIPVEAFEQGGAGEIAAWIDVLVAEPEPVIIVPVPVYSALDEGEVAISLPLGPVMAGADFPVPVVVNTGSHTVAAYNLAVAFDPDVLEVVSIDKGAATDLGVPTSNASTDANEIGTLSFNAINENPEGDTAQGDAVELAVIVFAVRDEATFGDSSWVSGAVHELVDTLMQDFSTSGDITVRGPVGSGILGEVDAAEVELVAIRPVPDPPTLMDLSVLTGDVPTAAVEVLAFRSDGSLSPLSEDESQTCEIDQPDIVGEEDCLLTAEGPGAVSITASAGGLEGETVLRVVALDPALDVTPLDSQLQYIFELDSVQTTSVRVLGTVSDGDVLEYTLDLTHLVEFDSSEDSVAAISEDGQIVPGLNGDAEIEVLAHDGAVLGSAVVQVMGGDVVQVTGLMLVIPAHVEMANLDPEPVPNVPAVTTATAKVTNLISGEGKQIQSQAYLIFSDDEETGGGSRLDVTGSGLVGYQSGIDGIGTVDAQGVVTAVGEGETEIYAVFTDVWGDVSADDTQPISVELPPPVAVEVTVTDPRVSISVEDRAWAVLGIPAQRPLDVEVYFEDGSSLSLSGDPRTQYEMDGDILTVPSYFDCLGIPGCSPGAAAATGTGTGTATVTVTFPGSYLEGLVGTIDLEVVAHEALVMESHELQTPEGEAPVTETLLSLIEGTDVWQGAALHLVDTFSDGSEVVLTSHPDSEYHVYMPGTTTPQTGVVFVSDDGEVTAQGTGTVQLVGEHMSESSPPVTFQVSASAVDLVSIEGYLEGGALQGVKDQVHEILTVRGVFGDGTRRLLSGTWLIPGLLDLNAVEPDIVTINSAAVLTGRGNGPTVVAMDVTDDLDLGTPFHPPALAGVTVNLVPAMGDVDLGEPAGNPFPDRPGDAIFEVPIRVNTGGFLLGGLDVEINYDPEVLAALGVTRGLDMAGAMFHANIGVPGTIYMNISPAVGQVAYGEGLEAARITFQALKAPDGPLVSPIGGMVRGVVDISGGPIGMDTPRAIVAGAGEIDPPPALIQGDANDDEAFDIRDVQFLQWIVAEPPLQIPNQTQEAQSDLFPDDSVDIKDAYFASQVLARLAHFIKVEAIPTAAGEFDLTAWVVDRDQELAAGYLAVSFEVLPGNNLEEIQFTLPHQQTDSGLLTEAIPQPDGSWGTHVSGLVSQESMGVVAILEILDGQGQVVRTTPFLATPFVEPDSFWTPLMSFGESWCVPLCLQEDCGDQDGCGGFCDGPCPGENEVCEDGACVCGFAQCAGACCEEDELCSQGECCQPTSCLELGATCGAPSNGCAANLYCGDCGPEAACGVTWTCECIHVECEGICCADGDICVAGACTCPPDCDGKECGADDGCGGLCDGPCPMDESYCNHGSCQCIYESCGGDCCGKYDGCQGGVCVPLCVPDCAGEVCGADNGCGDPCDGPCPEENQFCQEGQCACLYLQCGDQCCGEDEDCVAGECV